MKQDRTPVVFDSSALAEDARRWARPLIERLAGGFVSLYLYGSALDPEFDPARSDINLLLVTGGLSASQLRALGESWPELAIGRARANVVLLAEQEVIRSLDAFALELADIRARGRLLAGRDMLATLAVPEDALRTHLERELRTLVVRLRRAYLDGRNDPLILGDAVGHAAAGLLACARGAGYLAGSPVAGGAEATLAAAATWAGVEARPWLTAWRLRREPADPLTIGTLCLDLLDATEIFLRRVDAFAPQA